MVRKLHKLYTVFLSILSTSCLAGFYVGTGVGPDSANFSANATIKQFQNGRYNFNVQNKEELSGTGVFGTLFAGYAISSHVFRFKPLLYLAGEFNGNISSLTHDNSNDEYVHKNFSHTQIQVKNSAGVSVLPGLIFLENTIFYGRLGYSNGNFKITSTDASIGNLNKYLNGLRWGFGLQQFISPQVAVRLEFSQIRYNRTHTFTLDKVSNTSKYTSFKPVISEIEFGLIFPFC